MNTWELAEKIAKYVKNFGAKMTKEELTSAINNIIKNHLADD